MTATSTRYIGHGQGNADGVATFLEPWLARWGVLSTDTLLERDRYA